MKKEIDDNIIELTINELDKCISFWDIPSKLVESINSGKKKAFAYKSGAAYIGGCALSIREESCGHFLILPWHLIFAEMELAAAL